jgi:hypothetical protein
VKATKMTLFCKRINDDLANAWAPQPASATSEQPRGASHWVTQARIRGSWYDSK